MNPLPLTPEGCDLRDFAFMPLDVVRLRDSDFAAISDAEAFRAGLLLWCASWHQVPAASLPDDDVVLARLAGFGRVVKEWQKIREEALHGWVKCSDGRLYHPVIAEKAADAWQSKLLQRWKTECARLKKECQRKKCPYNPPAFEEWLSRGQAGFVPRDMAAMSPRQIEDVPEEKAISDKGHDDAVPDLSLGKPDPRDRDRDISNSLRSLERDAHNGDTGTGVEKTSAPENLPPSPSHRALALNMNLDLRNELGMFLANARSKGKLSADWNAEFEMWLRRSRNFGNGRDQQPAQARQSRLDAIASAADTLGVGSQYLNPPASALSGFGEHHAIES